jgi:hypothetical protein
MMSSDEDGPRSILAAADDDDTIMTLITEDPIIGKSLSKRELNFGSLSLASERNLDMQTSYPERPKKISKRRGDKHISSTGGNNDLFQSEMDLRESEDSGTPSGQTHGKTHGEYRGHKTVRNNGTVRRMKGKENEKSKEEQIKATASEIPSEQPQSDEVVAAMIRDWESRLLNLHDPNARIVIRVRPDGRDEYQREPYSKRRFILIAKAILAAGPTTDPFKQAKDPSKGHWQGKQVSQIC